MVLTELELLGFRNLRSQALRFPPEGAAIVGDNAQGKTNLLEAVYYLESFRSFRGASDPELPTFSEPVFRVAAQVEGGRVGSVTAAFDAARKRKKVTVDGGEVSPLSRALGHLGAVVFSPSDVELVSGGPVKRRRFLDIVLSLNEGGYVGELQRFRKALAQRNAALKQGGPKPHVQLWDEALCESGARVTRARMAWVDRWEESFRSYYASVSGGGVATLAYASRLDGPGKNGAEDGKPEPVPSEDVLTARLRGLLEAAWSVDSRRRTTTVGPHRDEMTIEIDDGAGAISARSFGSGGQRRSAALALRLVESATIRACRGVEPLLLLDDAFAELDDHRSGRIMSLVDGESTGQVIVTAPKEAHVHHFRGRLPQWRIREGVIEA